MKIISHIKSKLLSIDASPEKISKGYALGIFLSTTPFIGIKVFVALAITSITKWNRLASVIGVFHVNLFTGPLFYTVAYFVGRWITNAQTDTIFNGSLTYSAFYGSWEIFKALLVGGIVLGIPLTIFSYYLTYFFLSKQRKEVHKL